MAQFTAPKEINVQVVMKAEATAGTDVLAGTYTAADVVNIVAGSARFTQDQNEIENKMTAGNLGRAPSAIGKLTGLVEFSMLWRGKGSAYGAGTKPEFDMPLRAAGCSSVFSGTSGSEKVTYQPTSTEETFTVYVVVQVPGGNAFSVQLVGCLATTARCRTTAGGALMWDFGIMGALEERADITYVNGTLSPTPTPPVTKAALFQIGSTNYAPRIKSVGFDIGNTVQYIDSINAAGGVAGVKIFDRKPILTIDPEADREANSGWWAMLRDGAPLNDCTFQVGATAYNRLKFKFPSDGVSSQLQLIAQQLAMRDGLAALPSTLLPTISAGNDDWAIVAD